MTFTRLIPCLLLKDGYLVRSEGFSFHQVIGNPINQLERFSSWEVDELIYLDISRGESTGHRTDTKLKSGPDVLETLQAIADACFVPLTFGGGIKSVEDMRIRFAHHGADKIAISTSACETPELITKGAEQFGSQAIVVSIDVKENWVWSHGGRVRRLTDPVSWAKEVERRGAGEILLHSIERDGMGEGYDLGLIERVSDAVSCPVVALGGVGRWEHLAEGIHAGASAAAAANIFHFSEHSTQMARKAMHDAGIEVRMAGVST